MTQENLDLQAKAPEQQARLEQLGGYFNDMATSQSEYVQTGGSLRLCLKEIGQLLGPSQAEQQLTQQRSAYVNELLERPLLRFRPSRRQRRIGLRDDYVDGVVAKTERIVDAQTPEDSLALQQMPTLIKNTSFAKDDKLSMEDFSANHLYVLIDTALQEHAARRELISEHHSNRPLARFFGNRAVRMVLALGVFVATLTPELHVIPVDGQAVAEEINLSLQFLSAGIFSLEAPEEVRWRYLDFIHGRRSKILHDKLADSQQLSDLALRATYSSTRYGSSTVTGVVTDRSGTSDKAENLRRFRSLDEQFKYLNNDPGGKPYTGDQALGYAARLLIERKSRLAKILAASDDPDQQKELYLGLVKDILVEDVMRMEKGLSSSRVRQPILRAVGIIPAFLFPSAVALTNDASSGGKDVVEVVTVQDDNEDEG